MYKFPILIASSVIRSAKQGESHGGVYLIDLQNNTFKQVIDWNDSEIDWEGRGGDRGLRGIAFYDGLIFLAASDELFVYDQNFDLVERHTNKYLKHCHEIAIGENKLFLTSTGYDSILEFDLQTRSFQKGYNFRYGNVLDRKSFLFRLLYRFRFRPRIFIFDPNTEYGPVAADTLHINSVSYSKEKIFFSGVNIGHLFFIDKNQLYCYGKIPYKTHNAQPFRDGVLVNNTAANCVSYLDCNGITLKNFEIKRYDLDTLLMGNIPSDHARQGFGRGLCTYNNLIVGGSSPATISVYEFERKAKAIKTLNLTMDVRNSIHGLEIWPF